MIKDETIIYDSNTVPEGLDAETVIKIMQQRGIVFYDSTKGDKPEIVGISDIEIVDKKKVKYDSRATED